MEHEQGRVRAALRAAAGTEARHRRSVEADGRQPRRAREAVPGGLERRRGGQELDRLQESGHARPHPQPRGARVAAAGGRRPRHPARKGEAAAHREANRAQLDRRRDNLPRPPTMDRPATTPEGPGAWDREARSVADAAAQGSREEGAERARVKERR